MSADREAETIADVLAALTERFPLPRPMRTYGYQENYAEEGARAEAVRRVLRYCAERYKVALIDVQVQTEPCRLAHVDDASLSELLEALRRGGVW